MKEGDGRREREREERQPTVKTLSSLSNCSFSTQSMTAPVSFSEVCSIMKPHCIIWRALWHFWHCVPLCECLCVSVWRVVRVRVFSVHVVCNKNGDSSAICKKKPALPCLPSYCKYFRVTVNFYDIFKSLQFTSAKKLYSHEFNESASKAG